MSKILIANWKMYLSQLEALKLAQSLVAQAQARHDVELALCPAATALSEVTKLLEGSLFTLGAQNCFWGTQGPYTGEISAADLKHLGCKYVIIGHSERREHLDESDEQINKKLKVAWQAGLTPILCIGETEAERLAKQEKARIKEQLSMALQGHMITKGNKLLVAYEPVWAIYPSKREVDPALVSDMAKLIHEELQAYSDAKDNYRIVYGGSVDSKNIDLFLALDNIAGALIGHASTQLDEFVKIIKQVS